MTAEEQACRVYEIDRGRIRRPRDLEPAMEAVAIGLVGARKEGSSLEIYQGGRLVGLIETCGSGLVKLRNRVT